MALVFDGEGSAALLLCRRPAAGFRYAHLARHPDYGDCPWASECGTLLPSYIVASCCAESSSFTCESPESMSSLRPEPPRGYRWLVLAVISLPMFANYYIYDCINPLTDIFQKQLGLHRRADWLAELELQRGGGAHAAHRRDHH